MRVVTHDNTTKPFGYSSRSLTNVESKYDTTKRERLSIVWEVLILRPYLESRRFTIRIDQDSLKWILNLIGSTGRLQSWRLRISEFEFYDVYRASINHQAADALSRLRRLSKDKTPLKDNLPILVVHASDSNLANVDIVITAISKIVPLTATDAPSVNLPPTENEFIFQQANALHCKTASVKVGHHNSELHSDHRALLVCKLTVCNDAQIVVPASLHERIFHVEHHPPIARHIGRCRMYNTIGREFSWPCFQRRI